MIPPVDVRPVSSQPPQWLWIVTIWSGVALFDATQTVVTMRAEGMHHAWGRLFVTMLLGWLPWALATPLVLRLSHRSQQTRGKRFALWGMHLAACATVGMVSVVWIIFLEQQLNPWLTAAPTQRFEYLWLYKFYSSLLSFIKIG